MATTSSQHVGAVRERLAELLAEAIPGARFDPADLVTQTGRWAQQRYSDICRWCGDGRDEHGLNVHVASWDTMTLCARNGIEVTRDERSALSSFEVSARPKLTYCRECDVDVNMAVHRCGHSDIEVGV